MTVREVTVEVIRLAEKRNEEDRAADRDRGADRTYTLGSDALRELTAGPPPAEKALLIYLSSLPPDILTKLRTLMYVGRGDANDVLDFHADLGADGEDMDRIIFSMAGKSPLPRYLQRGIEVADAAKVDLDCPWPIGTPPDSLPVDSQDASDYAPAPARTFPQGQDPYVDGPAIFEEMAKSWTGDSIVEPLEIARFFDLLQQKTDGRVILDFIDLACWDQIGGHSFDPSTGYLELYWHDFREVDATTGRPEPDNVFLPASLYGLLIRLREIRIVRVSTVTVFLLCGHTLDRSDIKGQLAPGSSEHKAMPDNLFSSRFLRTVENQVHVFDVLTSPLYTAAILPKDRRIETSFSRAVMFELNLHRVRRSLHRAATAIKRTDATDTDAVCEKVNTIRRNWEQALKIEVILHDLKPSDSYNSLLLGDLLNLLRSVPGNAMGPHPGKMIGWANELSHDAGRAIELTKALAIADHVAAYVERLTGLIRPTPSPSR
jgi:hypothetical protein